LLSQHTKFARVIGRNRIATLDTWNERNATALYARRNHYVLFAGSYCEVVRAVDKYWKYDPQIKFYPKGRIIVL